MTTAVLGRFAVGPIVRVVPLAGGFSGSLLWKVTSNEGEFSLRRWPEETTSRRLAFFHAFQAHLRGSGLPFVPLPANAVGGGTIVEHAGRLWELATWMTGGADYHQRPTPSRLAAALGALARIHLAAARMPGQARIGASPGLAARLDQVRLLCTGGIERIEGAAAGRGPEWDGLARQICRLFRRHAAHVEIMLADMATVTGPLFPCLRDIWHDHVLFTGDEVTGIIDYGAARVESPAGDIARLVGSLAGDDAESWNAALAAYGRTVQTSAGVQRQLIRAFDASGVLLSGINWLTWLYVQQRQFDHAAVTRRLVQIVARLESM